MNSDESDYHGLLSDEEIHIIKKVIRKFCSAYEILKNYGFEDLMQEIVLKLYFAKTKYKVLNKSAIIKIAGNNLIKILRKQKTQKEQINYIKQSLYKEINEGLFFQDVVPDGQNFEKDFSIKYDMRKKMMLLSKAQQKICELLLKGYSQRKIAKKLKKSRDTISDDIKQIKNIYSEKK